MTANDASEKPPLDPWRFDELTLDDRKIWGAEPIAQVLGVSVATVYEWAKSPDVPIYRPAGRYFAFKLELLRWLRTKPSADHRCS